jgi:hypothetical protein
LLHGYTVGQLKLLLRAARLNRHQEIIRRGLGVALGINDSFARRPALLQAWMADLKAETSPTAKGPEPAATNPALAWFARQPRRLH